MVSSLNNGFPRRCGQRKSSSPEPHAKQSYRPAFLTTVSLGECATSGQSIRPISTTVRETLDERVSNLTERFAPVHHVQDEAVKLAVFTEHWHIIGAFFCELSRR